MRGHHIIYMLITILLVGCTKPDIQENGFEVVSGTEKVTISIASADLQTKSAKDGDIMKNLRVWLVKNGVVRYYSGNLTPDAAEEEVVFENVERGDYTMYIIANSTANSSYVVGSTINDAFLKATLPALVDYKPPFSDTDGMPMSLIKDIQVTAGTNNISAEIVRVCGKIRVTVHNKVPDKKVYLNNFKFTAKNPSSGYLFYDNHAVPDGTTYGEFSSLNAETGEDAIAIEAGANAVIFEQYLYESGSISLLGLDISGALFPKTFSGTPTLEESVTEEWQFTGSDTNTSINTNSWYVIANAASQRYFLYVNGSNGLTATYGEANDEEFLLKLNQGQDLKYLWKFSSNTNDGETSVRNYGNSGNGRYMSLSNSGIATRQNSTEIWMNLNNNRRRFGYRQQEWWGGYTYYYMYYSEGLRINSDNNNDQNKGWYLREIAKSTVSNVEFTNTEADNFKHNVGELQYIDDYGAPVTLSEICRNQILDIHLNVFHSESSGQLYLEVVAWKTTTDKETTFD